jgi:hypothetical protein
MATTIISSFEKLRTNLEITGLQSTTVSTRQESVRSVVSDGLDVITDFLTGSYMRSTMISPLNDADIDIFFLLDEKYYKEYPSPSALLDKVKRVLLNTYTRTPKISRNGQAVTIKFTDFDVDVVPAFYRSGGGFLIPNSYTDNWISTNPKTHVTYVSDANRSSNGMLVPIIKMIKAWNRNNGKPFGSFYLEILAVNVFSGITIMDYAYGMKYFFDLGRLWCQSTLSDPSGYGGSIGYGNSLKPADALSRFETAYSRATKAQEYASNQKIEMAINEWRKIFGDYFPAYG